MTTVVLAAAAILISGPSHAKTRKPPHELEQAVRQTEKMNKTVKNAGVHHHSCEPVLTAVPACTTGGSIRPPEGSNCGPGMDDASYQQMSFLARQAAQAVANNAGRMTGIMSCLFGEPVGAEQIIDAAAHVSQAFCSADPHRLVSIGCTAMTAAGLWEGESGPDFAGALTLRPIAFQRNQDNANAVGVMVTVIHETLHAIVQYLQHRYGFDTDPVARLVTMPAAASGASATQRSNRCLASLAVDRPVYCVAEDAGARLPARTPVIIHTEISAYNPGDKCADHLPLPDNFEGVCRAQGSYREEAAVRELAAMIGRNCAESIPMFFTSHGSFRAN